MSSRTAAVFTVAGFALGMACSSFEGNGPVVEPDDASTVPPPAKEGGPTQDADVGDGGADADAGRPDMVFVPVSGATGGGFWIDRTEVTIGAYSGFATAVNTHSVDAGWVDSGTCGWKKTAGPDANCTVGADTRLPITCIDWCDAQAYCRSLEKHLCGAIGGGSVTPDQQTNPSIAAWTRACAGGLSASAYPYGASADTSACNAAQNPDGGHALAPVATFPRCQGSVPGLFDMDGNAAEWIDSCITSDPTGQHDSCFVRGGMFEDTPQPCNAYDTFGRDNAGPKRGFRCCAEP